VQLFVPIVKIHHVLIAFKVPPQYVTNAKNQDVVVLCIATIIVEWKNCAKIVLFIVIFTKEVIVQSVLVHVVLKSRK
jgi:hypothetical protein